MIDKIFITDAVRKFMARQPEADGGEGSGNFGHKGRVGQVGGSGEGGASEEEVLAAENYVNKRKASIADEVRRLSSIVKNKNGYDEWDSPDEKYRAIRSQVNSWLVSGVDAGTKLIMNNGDEIERLWDGSWKVNGKDGNEYRLKKDEIGDYYARQADAGNDELVSDSVEINDECINRRVTAAKAAKKLEDSSMFEKYSQIDVNGLSADAANKVIGNYEWICEQFPFMEGRFAGIKAKYPQGYDDYNGFGDDDYNAYADEDNNIVLNLCTFASDEEQKSVQKRNSESGFSIASDNMMDAILSHELGHCVDNVISDGLENFEDVDALGVRSRERASDFLFRKTCEALSITPNDCAKGVSRYASTNHAEWFAECIAESRCAKEIRPVAAECMKQLKELLSKCNSKEWHKASKNDWW